MRFTWLLPLLAAFAFSPPAFLHPCTAVPMRGRWLNQAGEVLRLLNRHPRSSTVFRPRRPFGPLLPVDMGKHQRHTRHYTSHHTRVSAPYMTTATPYLHMMTGKPRFLAAKSVSAQGRSSRRLTGCRSSTWRGPPPCQTVVSCLNPCPGIPLRRLGTARFHSTADWSAG